MGKTKIPYVDETWNPVVGCTEIKSGCRHCWARELHQTRHKAFLEDKNLPLQYAVPFSSIQLLPARLKRPLYWRKPRTIFVNSMSDTFHKYVPFEFIDNMFETIMKCPQHKFLLFTKRWSRCWQYFQDVHRSEVEERRIPNPFPLPNVHLYFSASTQVEVDEAVPILLQIPAAVRGLSLEPLIESVDLMYPESLYPTGPPMCCNGYECGCQGLPVEPPLYGSIRHGKLDSIIVGCESGPKRRPCELEWIESIVNQCGEADVDCYMKQMEINGKVSTNPKEWLPALRVQEMPK